MLLLCPWKWTLLSGAGGQLNRVLVKTNTAFLVQVEGSAMYRTWLTLDVVGAYSKWALNISGPNSDWALNFEQLNLGIVMGLGLNWAGQSLILDWLTFSLISLKCP
jgi:hypothetical protein